jgi:hypothetical protein
MVTVATETPGVVGAVVGVGVFVSVGVAVGLAAAVATAAGPAMNAGMLHAASSNIAPTHRATTPLFAPLTTALPLNVPRTSQRMPTMEGLALPQDQAHATCHT